MGRRRGGGGVRAGLAKGAVGALAGAAPAVRCEHLGAAAGKQAEMIERDEKNRSCLLGRRSEVLTS